jgi:hypothetical protein
VEVLEALVDVVEVEDDEPDEHAAAISVSAAHDAMSIDRRLRAARTVPGLGESIREPEYSSMPSPLGLNNFAYPFDSDGIRGPSAICGYRLS